MLVRKEVFFSAVSLIGAHIERMEKVASAIHDPSDKADILEHINDAKKTRNELLQIATSTNAKTLQIVGGDATAMLDNLAEKFPGVISERNTDGRAL